MSFVTNNQNKSKTLMALYESCAIETQTLLRIIALIYEPVNQLTINKVVDFVWDLTECGVVQQSGKTGVAP